MRTNKIKREEIVSFTPNLKSLKELNFQGLTNRKDHYQIPHIFFYIIFMQQGQTSRGKKSHLQFSLPLGNNTWRTHLP